MPSDLPGPDTTRLALLAHLCQLSVILERRNALLKRLPPISAPLTRLDLADILLLDVESDNLMLTILTQVIYTRWESAAPAVHAMQAPKPPAPPARPAVRRLRRYVRVKEAPAGWVGRLLMWLLKRV